MRLNRRATFCLGITRQNIEEEYSQEVIAYSRPIACGDWPARRMRVFCAPTDWLIRRHDGEDRVPCCRPTLEKRREFSRGPRSRSPV